MHLVYFRAVLAAVIVMVLLIDDSCQIKKQFHRRLTAAIINILFIYRPFEQLRAVTIAKSIGFFQIWKLLLFKYVWQLTNYTLNDFIQQDQKFTSVQLFSIAVELQHYWFLWSDVLDWVWHLSKYTASLPAINLFYITDKL